MHFLKPSQEGLCFHYKDKSLLYVAKKLGVAWSHRFHMKQKKSKTKNISSNIPADTENASLKDKGLREFMGCFSHTKTSTICTEYNSK